MALKRVDDLTEEVIRDYRGPVTLALHLPGYDPVTVELDLTEGSQQALRDDVLGEYLAAGRPVLGSRTGTSTEAPVPAPPRVLVDLAALSRPGTPPVGHPDRIDDPDTGQDTGQDTEQDTDDAADAPGPALTSDNGPPEEDTAPDTAPDTEALTPAPTPTRKPPVRIGAAPVPQKPLPTDTQIRAWANKEGYELKPTQQIPTGVRAAHLAHLEYERLNR